MVTHRGDGGHGEGDGAGVTMVTVRVGGLFYYPLVSDSLTSDDLQHTHTHTHTL